MPGFILLKTPPKATSMCMGLEEAQAAPHTKIGHATYVIGECLAFGIAVLRSGAPVVPQALQKSLILSVVTQSESHRFGVE